MKTSFFWDENLPKRTLSRLTEIKGLKADCCRLEKGDLITIEHKGSVYPFRGDPYFVVSNVIYHIALPDVYQVVFLTPRALMKKFTNLVSGTPYPN